MPASRSPADPGSEPDVSQKRHVENKRTYVPLGNTLPGTNVSYPASRSDPRQQSERARSSSRVRKSFESIARKGQINHRVQLGFETLTTLQNKIVLTPRVTKNLNIAHPSERELARGEVAFIGSMCGGFHRMKSLRPEGEPSSVMTSISCRS
jgi:hypothetical protein